MKKLFLLLSISSFAFGQNIYVVRHAEKMTDSKDPDLKPEGRLRAEQLVKILEKKHIVAVYSTATKRTQQTAAPLATALQLPIQLYGMDTLSKFLDRVKAQNQPVLIVGHSNTILPIVNQLTGKKLLSKDLEDAEYNKLFVLKKYKKLKVQTF